MVRRVFISYEGGDRNRAKGFRLLKWNNHVDLDFFDRHLLDPVKSNDPEYIKRCIRERMNGCSVLVVLVGERTADSTWVDWEIRYALAQGKGVVGVMVKDATVVRVPEAMKEIGAEVLHWIPHTFSDAIERAAIGAGYVGSPASAPGGSAGMGCAR